MKKIFFLAVLFACVTTSYAQSEVQKTVIRELPVKLIPGLGYKISIPASLVSNESIVIPAVAPSASNTDLLISFGIDVANAKMINALRTPAGYRIVLYVIVRSTGAQFTGYEFVPVGR